MNEIFERMKEKMPAWMDMREGSYAGDNLRAVAAEIARIKALDIDFMPNRFFPLIAVGDDLTEAARNFGIERKAASAAAAEVVVEGEPGREFSGIMAAAGNVIFNIEDGIIGEDGKARMIAHAAEAGEKGNVAAQAINELLAEYEGIYSVLNDEAAVGGADEESDEALRERVRIRFASPSTGGNKADYESWALGERGVYAARAFNPEGGRVEIYIVGEGPGTADEETVEKVSKSIEERRPLGAQTGVYAAEKINVDIDVDFDVLEGFSRENVLGEMRNRVDEYIRGICFKSDAVSYLKLAGVLFAEGVSDITDYTLNGARESIAVGEKQFAALGEVREI